MTKSYKSVRPKLHLVYGVDDLMALYDVSRNTITNWIKAGLKPSDTHRPYVFRGAAVRAFHEDRRARSEGQLHPGEFKCLGCKTAVLPSVETIEKRSLKLERIMLSSSCPDCGAHLHKIASKTDLAHLAGKPIPNTTLICPHEGTPPSPGRIGKSARQNRAPIYLKNDRVIARWQRYAQKHSVKTQDKHLGAIRLYEDKLGGKIFSRLTIEDVSDFRETIRATLDADTKERRSRSTVSHSLSHVRDFLTWLLKQDDFDHLPKDLSGYLDLSRADYAAALPRPPRAYPSIAEAETMLAAMPAATRSDRRARALFATAFLGALRADTVTSLRLKHIDIEHRRIVQDAAVVRAKNGRSLIVKWFPIPTLFMEALTGWLKEMADLGCRSDDALFPSSTWMNAPRAISALDRAPISPMETKHAITEAFRIASETTLLHYTPHAAKHTIAALRDDLSLTHLQRKAWSMRLNRSLRCITPSSLTQIARNCSRQSAKAEGVAKMASC